MSIFRLRHQDEASESRMRAASLVEEVQTLQDRRSALYQSYDDTINKYKASKDSASFNANRKKVDADYKAITQQIASVISKLKAESSDVIEKVGAGRDILYAKLTGGVVCAF